MPWVWALACEQKTAKRSVILTCLEMAISSPSTRAISKARVGHGANRRAWEDWSRTSALKERNCGLWTWSFSTTSAITNGHLDACPEIKRVQNLNNLHASWTMPSTAASVVFTKESCMICRESELWLANRKQQREVSFWHVSKWPYHLLARVPYPKSIIWSWCNRVVAEFAKILREISETASGCHRGELKAQSAIGESKRHVSHTF